MSFGGDRKQHKHVGSSVNLYSLEQDLCSSKPVWADSFPKGGCLPLLSLGTGSLSNSTVIAPTLRFFMRVKLSVPPSLEIRVPSLVLFSFSFLHLSHM